MRFVSCLFALATVFSVAKASANSWNVPVLNCDGAKIEDICWSSSVTYSCRRQLLVFGEDAKAFMGQKQMFYPNALREFILPVLQTIPNSPDYKDESQAYSSNGRVVYIKPNQAGAKTLTVESFATTQPTGGIYTQGHFVDRYTFTGCN